MATVLSDRLCQIMEFACTSPTARARNGAENPILTSRRNDAVPRARPPYWLDPQYVGMNVVKVTRNLVETKAKPDSKHVDSFHGRESLYTAHTEYGMATDFFREARVAARKRFFEDLGYWLIAWEIRIGIPEDFTAPVLSFKYPMHLFDFRYHVVSSTTAAVNGAHKVNIQSFQCLLSSRLELEVLVDNYFMVGEGLLKNRGQKRGFSPARWGRKRARCCCFDEACHDEGMTRTSSGCATCKRITYRYSLNIN